MMTEFVVLRIVHVVGAMLWVGGAIYGSAFLIPVVASLGPGAGPVMAGLRARGLFVYLPSVAVLTVLSGVRLMWIASGGFSVSYFQTAWGAMYGASGALAIITFFLGMFIVRPHAMRVGGLAAQLGNTEDAATKAELAGRLAAGRRTAGVLTWLVTALLLASAAGMAVARYLA